MGFDDVPRAPDIRSIRDDFAGPEKTNRNIGTGIVKFMDLAVTRRAALAGRLAAGWTSTSFPLSHGCRCDGGGLPKASR